ncbi:MAG: hypothetical protein JXQ29_13860 [Planctomycetes bacterium]|nr:hypothetical protein [Planctomycetota bacterium]
MRTRSRLVAMLVVLSAGTAAAQDEYRFDLVHDEKAGALSGRACIRYVNDSSRPLAELRFRLDPNLSQAGSLLVSAVRDEAGGEMAWKYAPQSFGELSSDKGVLAVELPEPLEAGAACPLEIVFRLAHPRALAPELTVLQDDPYCSLDAWYPKAMSFGDAGWSFDDDRPSKYAVDLELNEKLVVASTGAASKPQPAKDGRVKRGLRADRVRGFTIYASHSWKAHARETDSVAIRCLLAEKCEPWATRLLEAAEDAIAYYRERYGEYPCKHLDIIALEEGSGAFAAVNVIGVFLGRGIEARYRWLVAHEVAHQYLGNLVDTPRREIYWVLIGLGMVMDRNYLIDRGYDHTFHSRMVGYYTTVRKQGRNTALSQPLEDILKAGSPWSFQWNLALGHGKAYAVCSMLEDLLGKELFEGVTKSLLAEHAGGMVTGRDLVAACQKAGAQDLSWFVKDWITGDATLDYAITAAERGETGIVVEVTQVGSAAFPVVVEAKTASGKTLRERLSRTLEVNRVTFPATEDVVEVVVGPGGIYPDLDPSNNRWPKPTR